MRAKRNVSLAVVLVVLLIWTFLPIHSRAQGPAGHLVVSTDYELFGISELGGGGHVTWTLTGAQAVDLRGKILRLFDGYPTVPRGFSSAGTTTNGNQNQRLDASEGAAFTDALERGLEAAGEGTLAQYMRLYPFDLRDKTEDAAASFIRSTTGLADTDLNATGDVEIRFLFEATAMSTDARIPLATPVLVDALYEPFSYRAAQSPDLDQLIPYPRAWPFLLEEGWHIASVLGQPALWPGNDSTGQYDNNVDASARTIADPAFGSNPVYEPFDLRYASRAQVRFNYTGLIGPGDALHLEYAHPPAYANWTALPYSGGPTLPDSAGAWRTETVDLEPVLGEQVRLRFRFVSDDSGVAAGIYVRDFVLEAPADYVGEVVQANTHYLIGTLSFSDPEVASGGIHLIRTPGGELLFYEVRWSGSPPAGDTLRFRTFAITESPQILFGIMLIASYAVSRMQESAYLEYREAHPPAYRPEVRKARWLHRFGKVAMVVLLLFYFVPTALWVVGLRVFVSGFSYWFLAASVILLVRYGTRAVYHRRLQEAPPPEIGEGPVVRKVVLPAPSAREAPSVATGGRCAHCLRMIDEGSPSYRCMCGSSYHLGCARSLARCATCRSPIAAGVVQARRQVSLRCESCGELQTVSEGTDPRAATCANCGHRLRRLAEGKRYLLVASNPAIAFAWMRDLTLGSKPALCMTPAAPERMRLEFGVKDVPVVQVSSTAGDAIDPRKLDPFGLRSILPLMREGKGGVILYDGLDEVIREASLGEVIHFLRKANDMAFVHGVTVIARLAPGRLTGDEVKRLNAEFDEYVDLSGQA